MLRIGYNPYSYGNNNTSFGKTKGSGCDKLVAGFHFKPKNGGDSSVTEALDEVADLFKKAEKSNRK